MKRYASCTAEIGKFCSKHNVTHRHPDYTLADQSHRVCPYCLASAEMGCDEMGCDEMGCDCEKEEK